MRHDEDPQGDVRPDEGATGHESSEIRIRTIVVFGVALAALAAVVMIVLAGLMRGFSAEEKKDGTTTADLVKERPGDFPTPRLQRNTTYDMERFKAEEKAALESYGWVDPKAGIAQIPIDRAIELLAQKGLPKPRPSDSTPKTPDKPAAETGKKER